MPGLFEATHEAAGNLLQEVASEIMTRTGVELRRSNGPGTRGVDLGAGGAGARGARAGAEQIERMEREWVPAASALLGARRHDFLAPLWRDIGQALEPAPFDPMNLDRHASRAYREGLDWERTRRSVLAAPGHEEVPLLLARLAEAHWRMRDRAAAIETWFALCRLAPEEFERLIETPDFPDWALRSSGSVPHDIVVEVPSNDGRG